MSLFSNDRPRQNVWTPASAAGATSGFSAQPPSVPPQANSAARLTSLRSAFNSAPAGAPSAAAPASSYVHVQGRRRFACVLAYARAGLEWVSKETRDCSFPFPFSL